MRNFLSILFSFCISGIFAQPSGHIAPEVIQGILVKITPPLSSFTPDPTWVDEIVRDNEGVIHEDEHNAKDRVKHPNAIPGVKGRDAVIQDYFGENKKRVLSIVQNFQGHGNTNVSPADPSLCVGSNHVIQMINGSSGARMTIYNKSGAVVLPAQYMDAITGINGLGDPVAIYDQFADRYVLTEFSSSGNRLVLMVSQTNDPTGSWYVYQFTAPSFPDYPKYGVWANAYICTTNESNNKVYAFDRPTMLTGAVTTTMLAFSIPGSPAVGFQAAAPVNISGTNMPPSGTLPMIMRMTDDGWGGGLSDALEMWGLSLDFLVPALSAMVQLPSINTAPFTSDLCGYVTLSCIRQPGSTRLDPIREIIMNRVWYRNFNTHQSIVLSHAVDATGLDQAGVRWYELRRTALGPWSIYQQSTYAPDTNSRWMGTIGINQEGSIGLVYNVSSKNVFPSLRMTGRKVSDPLNTMSEPEQVIIAGATNNSNNRWGDYNDMQIDPSNDVTFWTTGMYMPSPAPWSTRIAAFNILYSPLPVTLVSFEGYKANDTKNKLNWEAMNEKNLSRYEVERTIEGTTDFKAVGTLAALSNNATSGYSYTDDQINRSENYSYRLKMIDLDGKYRYSHVVNIQGKAGAALEAYPNPADNNVLYVRLSSELADKALIFTFTDYAAKKVKSIRKNKTDDNRILSFDISELANGLFIFSCHDTDGNILINKVIGKK